MHVKDRIFFNGFILHLDDHSLSSTGFRDIFQLGMLEHAEWKDFIYPDPALSFIEDQFKINKGFMAFITDFNHPGKDGYHFSVCIRLLEQKYKMHPAPIVLLTMCDKNNSSILDGLKQGVFTKYIGKDTDAEELKSDIESIIWAYSHRNEDYCHL